MPTLSTNELAELQRLRAQVAQLSKPKALKLKIGNKRNISVMGLQAFPVTLYKDQWLAILDNADQLRSFIETNDHLLDTKA